MGWGKLLGKRVWIVLTSKGDWEQKGSQDEAGEWVVVCRKRLNDGV